MALWKGLSPSQLEILTPSFQWLDDLISGTATLTSLPASTVTDQWESPMGECFAINNLWPIYKSYRMTHPVEEMADMSVDGEDGAYSALSPSIFLDGQADAKNSYASFRARFSDWRDRLLAFQSTSEGSVTEPKADPAAVFSKHFQALQEKVGAIPISTIQSKVYLGNL